MFLCVRAPILSTLPGFAGSNPHIFSTPNEEWTNNTDDLLSMILPFGAVPGKFYLNTFKKEKVLTYTFETLRDDSRNDLASITFILDKLVNVDNLKSIITEIFARLQEKTLLTLEILNQNLTNLTDSLNNESKLKIGPLIFDIAFFLKNKNQKLADVRRVKGGIV